MFTLQSVKLMAGGACCIAQKLSLVLCDDLEKGGMGGRLTSEGIYAYLKLIHAVIQ